LQANSNDPETLIYFNNAKANLTERFLTIAVSVPIGSNLNVAQEILRGIAQAQDEVNSHGGINGKLLQVEIANDYNQPDVSKKIADTFVSDRQILAAIGHNASDASIAAAPVYDRGKLVMLTPTRTIKFKKSGEREVVPGFVNLVKVEQDRLSDLGYNFVLIR
jgi:branched-chain amino acid transport system substrate-binding protein